MMGPDSVGPPTLPAQVSPPDFALSDLRPDALAGVEVLALPVLPGTGTPDGDDAGSLLLGPGAAEVADAVVWLLGDEASYCTGTILDVTGGR